METLADFGAVSVFNVDTFTTAIYKAWFGFFSLTTAAQLAALLIGVIFIVVLFEQYWQAKRGSSLTQGSSHRFDASKPAKLAMTLLCTLIFLIAFLIPFLQLIY